MKACEDNFKEYADSAYEKALLNSDFNVNGNSPRAVYHQSFIKRARLSSLYLYREIISVVNRNPLHYTIGDLISLALVVPLFPALIASRAYFGKASAKKEIYHEYKCKQSLKERHENSTRF